jgi:hypothetical protein
VTGSHAEATAPVGAESKNLKADCPQSTGIHHPMRQPLIFLATILTALAVVPGRAQLFSEIPLPSERQLRTENPPTDAERKSLVQRTLANQIKNDEALQIFERVERRIIHDHDMNATAGEDRTVRIIPTGTGSARILLAEHGRPSDAATIHAQMVATEHLLEAAADSSNAQTKRDREKIERRSKDRKDLVGSVQDAFVFTWMGREMLSGREVIKFRLDPNPNYKPTSLKTEFLKHATATGWVDEKSAQLARLEAVLTSDISFVGGIAGKVYRDGRALIEQSEVEPGVWLPTLYKYDYTVRKFMFTSEVHERVEASHYQRIGNAAQALTAIRREISAANSPRAQQ